MRPRSLALALVPLAVAACSQPERPTPPPPTVTLSRPVVRDVADSRVFVGTTRGAEVVEVRARVRGFLEAVEFEPGADVAAGDVLFRIEKAEFEAGVARAEAAVAQNRAELDRAEADLARVEEAVKTNAVSVSEVGMRRADRDKAAANVAAAEAAVREAALQLEYTDVVAPVAGRVSRNLVDVGNLVGAGDSTLLTTVVRLQPIHVYFDIPERVIVDYLREFSAEATSPGQEKERLPVAVALEGDEGFPHEGWIDFLENTVDPTTGTIGVRAVLPNEDLRLYSGLFARVRVTADTIAGAVLVEERGIGTDLGGKYVLTVGADGLVERRYVTLGPKEGGLRVVLDGLAASEEYISDGMVRARPGLPVNVERAGASD